MQSTGRGAPDLLRSAGGVLLATGAVVLFARKAEHGWGDFALLLVVAMPALVLYGFAIVGARPDSDGSAEPWRSVLMVTAVLLAPIVLLQLLQVLGVGKLEPLETAGIFAATAVIGAYGASRGRVRYAALLGGLASLVAWLIVWGRVLHHPSPSTFRLELIAGAAVLLLTAIALERAPAIGSSEVATAGGVAAVAAGALGVFVGTFAGVLGPLSSAFSHTHNGGPNLLGLTHPSGLQNFGWDLYLLVVSLALILVGSKVRSRGLGYVGGFGALLFVYSVAAEVTRLESGKAHTSSLVGWPLALLVLGAVGLFAPMLARRQA